MLENKGLAYISLPRCIPYFFDWTLRLLFFSLFILVWLLFKGSVYFVGKLVDSYDD